MSVRILTGDCREVMATLPDESVHCVVTSPPYWGLRDYKVPPSVWGGDADCGHNWSDYGPAHHPGQVPDGKAVHDENAIGQRAGSGQFCRHCNAWRGVLGLEPTPELHVQHIVEIFRHVRRVLRKDGTLWLNYGDCYAGSPSGSFGKGNNGRGMEGGAFRENKPFGTVVGGLKPKDLCLMPSRIARALQEPYYTGSIKRAEDRAWLAAAIEGEGCIYLQHHPVGHLTGRNHTPRKTASFGPGLKVTNGSEAFVRRCLEIARVGTVRSVGKVGRRDFWEWGAWSNGARSVLAEIYPHMASKRHQARIAIAAPTSGQKAAAAWESLKALHKGNKPTIDFPAPPSMFESGWWLRSEIVWAKKNPMPESITDRPTSSHEKMFLLTRSARYFYDTEAVRETAINEGRIVSYDGSQKNTGHQNPTYPGASGPRDILVSGRNLRNVWHIATHPYPDAHFATFPPALVEPCIKAGASEKGVCGGCGAPWARELKREFVGSYHDHSKDGIEYGLRQGGKGPATIYTAPETTGWAPSCKCAASTVRATVLDPFGGSGTVGLVADRLGRDAILIELNPEYADMARARITEDAPLFAEMGT